MKLVAVWIEKYMSIENLGFNLGDELHFKFTFDHNKRNLTVDVEKTNDYFDLFETSKIKNITGIIGNNGAGKTSFLKFLNLCESSKPIEFCAFLIFKDQLAGKYFGYNYGESFKVKKLNIIKENGFKEFLDDGNFKIAVSNNPFQQCNILFYSNLYSEHNDGYLKMENELNRSVDFMTRKSLDEDSIKYYNDKHDKLPDDLVGKKELYNVHKLYFEERFKQLLNFLSIVNTNHKELKQIISSIPFPEYLNLNFREDLFEQVNVLIERSLYKKFKRLREIIKFSLEYFDTEKDISKRFKNEITLKLFLYAFKGDLFKNTQPNTFLDELEDFVYSIKIDGNIFDEINKYMVSKKNKNVFFQITKLNIIFDKLLNAKYKVQIEEDRLFNHYTYKIRVTNEIWDFIKDINELFEIDLEPLMSFRWHPLSAGQEAILNQFVQYWVGLKHVKQSSLLINIDEGELYLHPEWQRQYIDLIFTFLDYCINLNPEIENAQIVLTSHSPFVVCDIPKHSLVFMKREKANEIDPRPKVKILDSQNHQATFGGNIFDIYKNSFFLEDFFGAFSSKWLNSAFKKVNESESNLVSDKYDKIKSDIELQKFIQIIGEKVVKDVLQTQLANKSDLRSYEVINLTEKAKKSLSEFMEKKKEKSVGKGHKKNKK